MGQPKTDTERLEHLRDDATRACLEAGAIRQCDEHEDVFLCMQDEAADREAYRLGSAMVFDGDTDATQNEMALAIADAIGSASLKCPLCEMDKAVKGEPVAPIKARYDIPLSGRSAGLSGNPPLPPACGILGRQYGSIGGRPRCCRCDCDDRTADRYVGSQCGYVSPSSGAIGMSNHQNAISGSLGGDGVCIGPSHYPEMHQRRV